MENIFTEECGLICPMSELEKKMRKITMIVATLGTLFFSAVSHAKVCKLTILHFNDMHGYLEPEDDDLGGAARIATLVDKIRAENIEEGRGTLLLNGGDIISGTMISAHFKGEAEFEFLNRLDADAMVLGNHEFDFGQEPLINNAAAAEFPVLSANVVLKKTGKPVVLENSIFEFDDGCFAGVFGITSEDTKNLALPSNLEGLVFLDELSTAKKQMTKIAPKSDIQIALTHVGVASDHRLAREVKGLEAVIGGHDHVGAEEYCAASSSIPICQTPAKGKYLGRVDIDVEDGKVISYDTKLYVIDKSIAKSRRMKKALHRYFAEVKKYGNEKVGKIDKPLVRSVESAPGSEDLALLVARAIREVAGSTIGLMNTGGVRRDIPAGKVRKKDLFEALPFGNTVVVVSSVTGAEIAGLVAGSDEINRKQQKSFVWDNLEYSKDGTSLDIRIGGAPLNMKARYDVATNSFLAQGGDGALIFKDKPQRDLGVTVLDVVIDDISARTFSSQ